MLVLPPARGGLAAGCVGEPCLGPTQTSPRAIAFPAGPTEVEGLLKVVDIELGAKAGAQGSFSVNLSTLFSRVHVTPTKKRAGGLLFYMFYSSSSSSSRQTFTLFHLQAHHQRKKEAALPHSRGQAEATTLRMRMLASDRSCFSFRLGAPNNNKLAASSHRQLDSPRLGSCGHARRRRRLGGAAAGSAGDAQAAPGTAKAAAAPTAAVDHVALVLEALGELPLPAGAAL